MLNADPFIGELTIIIIKPVLVYTTFRYPNQQMIYSELVTVCVFGLQYTFWSD